jgi:flagellar biosynthetic protein FlhB
MPEERFEDRTEPATPRRRQEVRQAGRVARSMDLNSAVVILAGILALNFFGKSIAQLLIQSSTLVLGNLDRIDAGVDDVYRMASMGFTLLGKMLLPIVIAVIVCALAINFAQVGFVVSFEPFTPNIERFNPITGLGRIFSLRGLVRLCMSVLKVIVVGVVLFLTMWAERYNLVGLIEKDFLTIVDYIVEIAFVLMLRAALAILLVSLLDRLYQKWQFERDIMMTRTEVKEELKRLEGDPKIRERRRALHRQLAIQRMLGRVPRATVVITNPVEIAVALQYERMMEAPLVIAKGKGVLAERIKRIALDNGIPIVERPPLAQALYRMVEVGEMIPPLLYEAVAEVIAYVYRLRSQALSA